MATTMSEFHASGSGESWQKEQEFGTGERWYHRARQNMSMACAGPCAAPGRNPSSGAELRVGSRQELGLLVELTVSLRVMGAQLRDCRLLLAQRVANRLNHGTKGMVLGRALLILRRRQLVKALLGQREKLRIVAGQRLTAHGLKGVDERPLGFVEGLLGVRGLWIANGGGGLTARAVAHVFERRSRLSPRMSQLGTARCHSLSQLGTGPLVLPGWVGRALPELAHQTPLDESLQVALDGAPGHVR